ncbi:zinc-binding dehydrogenase (plasmid) [Phyllobacterium zundukense]|uniref:Zinc-binding dehydrogenase n=1 Tax=Phyllobacterium zundukense TaxID=1867719 RepID=A0ACD4D092_9HYPH|nr:zinc-binding dehydrogenase [Phyllobacterium zundukense]UXN59214.1 zinc-binding dehydrogenase [Phyllobacterium zundukense]
MKLPRSIKTGYATLFRPHPQPGALPRSYAAAFRLVGDGSLKVKIDGVHALAEAARAHIDMESRATTGKLLLAVIVDKDVHGQLWSSIDPQSVFADADKLPTLAVHAASARFCVRLRRQETFARVDRCLYAT